MTNKYRAVMELISQCPLVGRDLYFNFIDEGCRDGNTTLTTVPYGQVARRYVDGARLMKMQFEIRQIKPLAMYSNTAANTESIDLVREFSDWINEMGRLGKFPEWDGVEIIKMSTPDEAGTPSFLGVSEGVALYAFPFEILYLERSN